MYGKRHLAGGLPASVMKGYVIHASCHAVPRTRAWIFQDVGLPSFHTVLHPLPQAKASFVGPEGLQPVSSHFPIEKKSDKGKSSQPNGTLRDPPRLRAFAVLLSGRGGGGPVRALESCCLV